jgi:hypothetical protein
MLQSHPIFDCAPPHNPKGCTGKRTNRPWFAFACLRSQMGGRGQPRSGYCPWSAGDTSVTAHLRCASHARFAGGKRLRRSAPLPYHGLAALQPSMEPNLTDSASLIDPERRDIAPLGRTDLSSTWLALIRKYIRGEPDDGAFTGAHTPNVTPVTAAECAARLADADRVFAGWLAPLGRSAAQVAGIEPARIAVALNHMHHESRRLTMCDDALLDNVVTLAREVIERRVPGDFIEAGAWRGGVTILMRAALTVFGDLHRTVWVADSFAGLPAPDPASDLRDAIWHHVMRAVGLLQSDLDGVRSAFARAGLLDRRVRFLPGWFADTLPAAPIERLALMRLDGDWYDSTRDALEALYPRLSPGGFVIVDDYGLPTGCARAVDEYREQHGIDAPLEWANQQAVYWRKPS